MFLSLPIPAVDFVYVETTYVPIIANESPKKFIFKFQFEDTNVRIKEKIAQELGIEKEELIVTDVYHSTIFRWLDDRNKITNSVKKNDYIVAYHVNQKENFKIIQLIHRVPKGTQFEFFGFPQIVSIDCSQALDHNRLYEIVINNVRKYINNPTDTPLNQLFTLIKIRHPHAISGVEITPSDNIITIENKDIICFNWNDKSYYNENFHKDINFVNLEENISRHVTLQNCFELFLSPEQLAPSNEWYCRNCDKLQLPVKKLDIWFPPKYLIIHLKRFNVGRGVSRKNNSFVDYPIYGLDISPYIFSEEYILSGAPVYDLYAVSIHGGSIEGGHYTAMAKNFMNNQWYNFNDGTVLSASENDAVSASAYLLFYKRRGINE